MKNKKWSKDQIQILKDKYAFESWDVLQELLFPFKKSEIIAKASNLKIKREKHFYSQEEIDFLINNYDKYSNKQLSEILKKSPQSIATKANKLKISNSSLWNEEEVDFLRQNYSSKSNINISKFIKRSSDSIGMKARELGLKKEKMTYYDLDEFILNLKNLANEMNRTPFFHETISQNWSPSPSSIQRYFGGYRKACEIANLDINANIFGSSFPAYKSENSDLCWSKSELIITNFFINNNINYKKEVLYADYINDSRCNNKKCDWVINDGIFVEYFGMMDKHYYKEKSYFKTNLCNDNNVLLISLFEKDLKNLKIIFEDYI